MTPAKLLGLPQTEDSIIVRGGDSWRALPRLMVQVRAEVENGDTEGSRNVLHSLIALRRKRVKE